jgi:Domain of unknown function (DUF4383)
MRSHLPVDHPLVPVYRVLGALTGLFLIVFGAVGWSKSSGDKFTDSTGVKVLGMHANGLLSVLSLAAGVLLVLGALRGGNLGAAVNFFFGCLYTFAGLGGLAIERTSLNVFAYTVGDLVFSMVVGFVLLAAGLYGQVSGKTSGRGGSRRGSGAAGTA